MSTLHWGPRLRDTAFALCVALDGGALALMAVLGLAAAGPSHTPVVSVLGFFAVPALALAAAVWGYWHAPWPLARPAALALAGLPALLLAGGLVMSQIAAWKAGAPADGWGQPDAALQQQLEVAIAAHDVDTVTRIAGRPDARLNGGAALVAAIRQLERTPGRVDVLQALLRAGLHPDASGGAEAPLAAAARASARIGAEPVRLLLDAGANPNDRPGGQPAWFAALSPRTDPAVLPTLLDRGADLRAVDMAGQGPVQRALSYRHWAAVALLIERGAAWQGVHSPDGHGLQQATAAALRQDPGNATLQRLAQRLRTLTP